ncbi:hypothetical protein AB0M45_02790 [Nocardia sp. NPDC051787]|uniref:hypothetical protein n=1 Tax=Nocardia sp. NPDC051787 TaxID=3155415 RepID=UPI00343091D1
MSTSELESAEAASVPATRRGKLLLRRYDENLTLVAPAQGACGLSGPRQAVS